MMACAKSLRRYDELVTISKSKAYGEHAGDAMVASYARRRRGQTRAVQEVSSRSLLCIGGDIRGNDK